MQLYVNYYDYVHHAAIGSKLVVANIYIAFFKEIAVLVFCTCSDHVINTHFQEPAEYGNDELITINLMTLIYSLTISSNPKSRVQRLNSKLYRY